MDPTAINEPRSAAPGDADEKTRLLKQAAEGLERGDFGSARQVLRDLAGKRAAVLRERLRPDPLVLWLILTCAVLFTALVAATARRY